MLTQNVDMDIKKRIKMLRQMETEILYATPTKAAKLARKITKCRGQVFVER